MFSEKAATFRQWAIRGKVVGHLLLGDIDEVHLQPRADVDQDQLIACVDAVASHLMRSLLHHPAVKSLEAAWRGLQTVVKQLPTGTDLQVSAAGFNGREK